MTTVGPPASTTNLEAGEIDATKHDEFRRHHRSRNNRKKQSYRSRRCQKSCQDRITELVHFDSNSDLPRTVLISINEPTLDHLLLKENSIVLEYLQFTKSGSVFKSTPLFVGNNVASCLQRGKCNLSKLKYKKLVILTSVDAIVKQLVASGMNLMLRSVSVIKKYYCPDEYAILVFAGHSPCTSQHTSLVPLEVQRDIFMLKW